MASPSLVRDLRALVGSEHALGPRAAGRFAIDGVAPAAVVRPGTYEEVATVLGYAHAGGLAVVPWGAGTMMGRGNAPRRYDIALDLSRLDQLVEHEPADLTVTCQAGLTLGALQSHLAQAGQMAPFDPSLPEKATIGGVLALAADGPARSAYGGPRDFTIGMKVVTADGRITKAGGRVVKNVAGYDLCKLYIGSLGTLGVIVEATFKLIPRPRVERSLAVGMDEAAEACGLAREAHRRGITLRAAILLNDAGAARARRRGSYVLALDLAGSPAAVERSGRDVAALARESGAFPLAAPPQAPAAQPLFRCRFSILPSRLPDLLAAVEVMGNGPTIVAAPLSGLLWAEWRGGRPDTLLSSLRDTAARLQASVIVERCPTELKRSIDVFGEPPPAFALMRRLKREFDPADILSPGRFVGGL